MARQDLNGIAEEALSRIDRIPDSYRPTLNKTVHIAKFQKNFIKGQIVKELIGKKKITKEQSDQLDELVRMYVKEALKLVESRKSSTVYGYLVLQLNSTSQVTRPGNDFRVIIYGKKSTAIPFAEGSRLQKNAEKLTNIQKELEESGKPLERRNLARRASSILGVEEKRLFETGHAERTGVADVVAMEAFSVLSTPTEPIHFTSTYTKTRQAVVRSNVKANRDKEFIIELTESFPEIKEFIQIGTLLVPLEPQAVKTNKALAVLEKRDLKNRREELKKFLGSKSWATQEASPSKLEDTKAILIEQILKMPGAKFTGKRPRKAKVGESSSEPIISKVSQKERSKMGVTSSDIAPKTRKVRSSPTMVASTSNNWNSLIPIINAKLGSKVMANMRAPSLVNRTGTFANSAQVTNIEQTREGFPTFVFDYEKDPYNVFDRTVGRSPWNTPERDPRALVDKSVREIVREMAIGRFYTRRA